MQYYYSFFSSIIIISSIAIPNADSICSTLEERAKRLFSTKGVSLTSLDSSMFAKSKSVVQEVQKHREMASLEAMVYKYSELLGVSQPVHDIH